MMMDKLGWLKKGASLLLALCFVLPLSMCRGMVERDGKPVPTVTYTYGYKIAGEGYHELSSGKLNGLIDLLAVFTVFFLPLACLRLKPRAQDLVHVAGAFPAAYFLGIWVFVMATRPETGGLLAVACWLALFGASAANLVRAYRRR